MKRIALANRESCACVSDEDFDFLTQFRWFASKQGYAQTTAKIRPNAAMPQPFMHTLIVERVLGEIPDGMQVDHRDLDKLNNTRENLRLCTPLQQAANHRKGRCRLGVSRYKGVSRTHTKQNPWRAQVAIDGINHHLGVFPTEEAAAHAYDAAAKERFGEFAWLNFPAEAVTP